MQDPEYFPVLLFPGKNSVELKDRHSIPWQGKKLRLVVPDGTWTLVKRMIKNNDFLDRLPQIRVTPPRPTWFILKKEPDNISVSTIEAVYYFLDQAQKLGWEKIGARHEVLPAVLHKMVAFQLECTRKNRSSGRRYS